MANNANIVRRANNANRLVKGKCYQKQNNGMYLGAYYGEANGAHLFTYATVHNNQQNVINNLVNVPCRNNHAQVPAGGKTRRNRKSVRKTRRGRKN